MVSRREGVKGAFDRALRSEKVRRFVAIDWQSRAGQRRGAHRRTIKVFVASVQPSRGAAEWRDRSGEKVREVRWLQRRVLGPDRQEREDMILRKVDECFAGDILGIRQIEQVIAQNQALRRGRQIVPRACNAAATGGARGSQAVEALVESAYQFERAMDHWRLASLHAIDRRQERGRAFVVEDRHITQHDDMRGDATGDRAPECEAPACASNHRDRSLSAVDLLGA
jgi:hypothetical protein